MVVKGQQLRLNINLSRHRANQRKLNVVRGTNSDYSWIATPIYHKGYKAFKSGMMHDTNVSGVMF